MRQLFALLILAAGNFLLPLNALAQWQVDGIALSTAANEQHFPAIVTDGAGGAIVTWYDYRNGNADIYAQRVNASGVPQWTSGGVALCTAANSQEVPTIVSDGAGGAIVTWSDFRSGLDYDIYAQRVNASGVPQWAPADGVALSIVANDQSLPTIVSDGAGGAIVTWHDFRSLVDYDIYAQRVNASGVPQWAANGVALSTAANDQIFPTIVSDGAGGAIVTWYDYRSGSADIYAQRVNASGVLQWTPATGVALSTAANDQYNPMIVSDGAGGAIVSWYDYRSGNADIFARRVNASGVPQWTADGVALSTAANDQRTPTIVSDGAGGAIVTWYDNRTVANWNIYAQRVDALGNPQWTANGVGLSTAAGNKFDPTIVTDGAGGAVVTWFDQRSGGYDVYAQRVNASGVAQWAADGVALSAAANDQWYPTIVADGAGGAIVTWYDYRSGSADIYAQHVEGRYGYWGRPEPALASVADVPGDQGGKVKVNWYASGRDALNQQVISHYSIWRATDASAAASAALVSLSEIDRDFSRPAIRVEQTPTADYFWELVATQDAIYLPSYAYSALTSYDSTAAGSATHRFQVISHAYYSQFINWPSNVVSGHSVDNLAPAAPLFLTAQRVGADVQLRWNRVRVPDFKDYSVYRKTSSGVTPVPINFLSNANDTLLTDAGAPTSALYYIVAAHDVHANQGPPSNEASVGATTGVGNTPPISTLTVLENVPNPFAATTTLRVGLPKASEVDVEVFDVAGHRVRSERTASLAAGWRDVTFEAHDAAGKALPSGVYFYRITAAGATLTRKMVIAR